MAQYGWVFGVLWFCTSVLALVLHDPTTVDPELDHIRDQAGMF